MGFVNSSSSFSFNVMKNKYDDFIFELLYRLDSVLDTKKKIDFVSLLAVVFVFMGVIFFVLAFLYTLAYVLIYIF